MTTLNLEQAKRILGERMDVYARHRDQYHQPEYKEAQLRREFLDPFFEALGWDVTNRQGWAEQFKEVINEDALKIAGTTKAPDYSFRIGGARKFFAEAKKPRVGLETERDPKDFRKRSFGFLYANLERGENHHDHRRDENRWQ